MKKKIMVEIQCADDGVHCGKCEKILSTTWEGYKCTVFERQVGDQMEGIKYCKRDPACIAADNLPDDFPTTEEILEERRKRKSIIKPALSALVRRIKKDIQSDDIVGTFQAGERNSAREEILKYIADIEKGE